MKSSGKIQTHTRPSLKNLNPVFHKRNKAEDNDSLPAGLLKQARQSGSLNLTGRGLVYAFQSYLNKTFMTASTKYPSEKHTLFGVLGHDKDRRYFELRELPMNPFEAGSNQSDEPDKSEENKCEIVDAGLGKNDELPEKVFDLNDPDKDNKPTLESLTIKDDEAWWNQVELNSLDLSSNRLTELSPKISQLDSLTNLILYDNGLSHIPKEISKLEKLTRINLGRNQLKELPQDFYTLPELRYLNISYNCMEELHPAISDLHMLEVLDASNNNIVTVPCGIGFLVRLIELNLSHNHIKELPPDIVNMRCLQKLDLMNNELSQLPKDIGCLRKLQCLYLQHNNIVELPTFEGCQELQEIHISNNFIERIPRRLCVYLTHLKIFDIRDNKLTKLPDEISYLKVLIRLDISNNSVAQLPPSLGHLPHLVSLQVEGNPIKSIRSDIIQSGTVRLLKTLRDRALILPQNDSTKGAPQRTRSTTESSDEIIASMPNDGLNTPRNYSADNEGEISIYPNKYTMRQTHCLNVNMQNLADVPDNVFEVAASEYVNCIDFSKNQLTTLPKGVLSMSKCATELVFANNAITEIPTFVSQFKHIALINISCNMLKDLPKEFGLLNTLRELNINNNRFDQIPSCVYDLRSLEILLARDNRITSIDATPQGLGSLKRLATLDLGNNYIEQVPPILGSLQNITTLEITGNPFRAPRHQILQKGTDAIMSYLRDRIPK